MERTSVFNSHMMIVAGKCDENGVHQSEIVVLAAGRSAEIAGWLGYDIPMAWERGYHLHFESQTLTGGFFDQYGRPRRWR